MSDAFRLDGEVVLLTGAVGGLGLPMARALAAAGASLVIGHVGDEERARELSAELTATGTDSLVVEADVTDAAAVDDMFRQIERWAGRCTVVVNNAGLMEEAPFLEMTQQQWDHTVQGDLTGPMLVCQRFARQAAGRGVIVNVSSQLAFKGARNFVSYSAAKAGVVGLTRALARELGPGIRVNAIAPGPVLTPLIEDLAADPAWVAERTSGAVTGAIARPEEIAPVVVFLAAQASTQLHGQVLHVNGGGVMM